MKITFKVINGTLHEYQGTPAVLKNPDGFEVNYDYDAKGNEVHSKDSNGYEVWKEYDANGKEIHSKDSNGYETWSDAKGNLITKEEFDKIHTPSCDGKIVTIYGKSGGKK